MYLQKHLKNNFSLPIRERGSAIFGSGLVSAISGNQWSARATVQGAVLYKVALQRVKEKVRAECECPFFESSGLCKHVWATILAADRQNYLLGSIGSPPPRTLLAGVRA